MSIAMSFANTPCTLSDWCWPPVPHMLSECRPRPTRDVADQQLVSTSAAPTIASAALPPKSAALSFPDSHTPAPRALSAASSAHFKPAPPKLLVSDSVAPGSLDQLPATTADHASIAPTTARSHYSYEDVPQRDVLLAQFAILRERSADLAEAGAWLKRHYILRTAFDHMGGRESDSPEQLNTFLASVDEQLAPRFDIAPAEQAMLMGWIPTSPVTQEEQLTQARKKVTKRRKDLTVSDAAHDEVMPVVESDAAVQEPAASERVIAEMATTPASMSSHGSRPINSSLRGPSPIAEVEATTPLSSSDSSDTDDHTGSESGSETDASSLHTPSSSSPLRPAATMPYPGLSKGPMAKQVKRLKNPHLAEGLNLLPEHVEDLRRGSLMKFIKGGQHPRVLEHDSKARARREEHMRWFDERWKVRMAEKPKFCTDEEQCVCGWGERIKGPRPIETKPRYGPRNLPPNAHLHAPASTTSVTRSSSTSSRRSATSQAASDSASIRTIAPSTHSRSPSIAGSSASATPSHLSRSSTIASSTHQQRIVPGFTTPYDPELPARSLSPMSVKSTAPSKVSQMRARWEVQRDAASIRSDSSGSVYSGTQASVYV